MKRFFYIIFVLTLLYTTLIYRDRTVDTLSEYRQKTQNPSDNSIIELNTAKLLTVTPFQKPTATPQLKRKGTTAKTPPQEEWGVAREISEGTYTIRIGSDAAMGNPQEVFAALNAYRNTSGRSSLSWDDGLASYAQGRADHMNSIKTTDGHEGFNRFLEQEDGFNKLGFYRLGENSYYGGPLNGTHVIEWVFAKSPGHDANQKDAGWTHVGIGVTDSTVNLIFGGSKM